jgi:hypothetical protein
MLTDSGGRFFRVLGLTLLAVSSIGLLKVVLDW